MMEAGTEFDGFVLGEKLGSGGMATVYRALQKSLDRPVVLKILHPHLAEDATLVARFEREARAAALLRHENIVQVIDCGRREKVSFIAMEYVEGKDLRQLLDAFGPPPIEIAVLLLRDICRGLDFAHQQRVIHRDIKPANLMLTPGGTVKIMDFGLARRGDESSAVTVEGSIMGTPAYMSPEQAEGKPVGDRSDVFSLGIVTHELLSGGRPFAGDSYPSIIHAIVHQEPEPLGDRLPSAPETLATLILRMLAKDPAKRCSCAAAREELEAMAVAMGLHRGQELLQDYAGDPAGSVLRLQATRAGARTIAPDVPAAAQTAPGVMHPPTPGRATRATRKPALLLAGAGLAILVAAGAVFLATRGRAPDRSGSPAPPSAALPDTSLKLAPGRPPDPEPKQSETTPVRLPATRGKAEPERRAQTPPPESPASIPPQAPGAQAESERARTYRVSSKPSFAYLFVDGRAINPDGMLPARVELKPGTHTFRAVNEDLRLDLTFPYRIEPGDDSNTLILNLETGKIEPRRNQEPPL